MVNKLFFYPVKISHLVGVSWQRPSIMIFPTYPASILPIISLESYDRLSLLSHSNSIERNLILVPSWIINEYIVVLAFYFGRGETGLKHVQIH